ncbi:MAG: DUF805 domain-containing protein [Chloroflexota bacterium]
MRYLLDFTGTIGRLEFLALLVLSSIIGWVSLLVQAAFLPAGGMWGFIWAIISLGIALFGAAVSVSAWIRRLRDLELSPWLALLMLVPLVNLGMAIFLLLKGEPVGDTVYGAAHTSGSDSRRW